MPDEDFGTEPPEIPNKRYFTISEASELCRVPQSKLRYWEERFSDILKVQRRNNRRFFTRENLLTVRKINHLIEERGLSADDVADYYQNDDDDYGHVIEQPEVKPVEFDDNTSVEIKELSPLRVELNEIIRDLQQLRQELRALTD